MLKELWERQSIRKYLNKPVEPEKIEELLRAAMNAPTARNSQSWRFLVVTDRNALDTMTDLQPYTGMMKTAACAIIVMGDRNASQPDEYLYVDSAAAIENILIEPCINNSVRVGVPSDRIRIELRNSGVIIE